MSNIRKPLTVLLDSNRRLGFPDEEASKVSALIRRTKQLLTEKMSVDKSEKNERVQQFMNELSAITVSFDKPSQALSTYIVELEKFQSEITDIANKNKVLKGSKWKNLFDDEGGFRIVLTNLTKYRDRQCEYEAACEIEKVKVIESLLDTIKKCDGAVIQPEKLVNEIDHILGVTSICKKINELYSRLERQPAAESRLFNVYKVGSPKNDEINKEIDRLENERKALLDPEKNSQFKDLIRIRSELEYDISQVGEVDRTAYTLTKMYLPSNSSVCTKFLKEFGCQDRINKLEKSVSKAKSVLGKYNLQNQSQNDSEDNSDVAPPLKQSPNCSAESAKLSSASAPAPQLNEAQLFTQKLRKELKSNPLVLLEGGSSSSGVLKKPSSTSQGKPNAAELFSAQTRKAIKMQYSQLK